MWLYQPPVLSFSTKSPITRLVLRRHSSDTFVLSYKQLWDKNHAYFSSEDNAADTFLLLPRGFSIDTPASTS